jgi:hypothetical protein
VLNSVRTSANVISDVQCSHMLPVLQVTYRAPPGAIGECGAFFNALALEPGLWEFVQHSGADLYRRYCGLIFSRVYSAPRRRPQGDTHVPSFN